ncbi:MAG: ABC transporter ATP-binding protein [Candidatus Lokiarchaeota archaeon]|nr:ABC transporter ATP-binding protein [Candidatus Lokiarchaeota archaeon]
MDTEKELMTVDNTKPTEMGNDVLLRVNGLKTQFFTEEGVVKAVDGVSFNIFQDEVLGLVGETGCGKSVTALSILRLVRDPGKIIEGKIFFDGLNLLELSEKDMRKYRGNKITMIFQDPLNSLNPVIKVGDQIGEVFMLHQREIMQDRLDKERLRRKEYKQNLKLLTKRLKTESERLTNDEKLALEAEIQEIKKEDTDYIDIKEIVKDAAAEMISKVGIADARNILDRYPHELSGGMRQRVMIAMALTCNPKLLIADEPTTALDVTIQAQILELMKELKQNFKTSILMITHDLGIIAEMCDRVAVMYSGNIVEYAPSEQLFKNPRHPYTQGLIGAIPRIDKRGHKLKTIRGMVPNLIYPPSGCRFHPRCPQRLEVCDQVRPEWIEIENKYFIACHLFDDKYKDSPKYQWEEEEKEESFLV